ncbi:MAG: hypothetical protein A2X61_00595 [Ignavibacteria bacterium GWB2_35_12]|nr:MAG: hypothetical protein A2X61_00595 [Ignavibacteria bacterium GWB2_35_12]OGU85748.1 MAG: hypothetical protein A2220_03205 [Ignavibacteria bacterium RIFOXYA2_FULL_35_10]OGV19148.1 MAG: hypothetical protein A2475_00010 [Ignavibacteria bacterium RIFOXYC2_FULL_35_21]
MKQLVIILIGILLISNSIYSKDFWERVNVPNDTPTQELAIDTNGNLYSCYFGMYKSGDDGTTWQVIDEVTAQGMTIKLSHANILLTSIYVAKNGYLFTSMMDGLTFRSKDDGISWEVQSYELQNIHGFISCNNGRVFANRMFDLYYSDDYGDTWTRYNAWPESNYGSFSKSRMALSPSGMLFAWNNGIWVIDPDSLTYNYYTEGIDSSYVRCFAFGNGKVFAGTDTSGVFVSTDDGVTWSKLVNSPSNVSISSMVYTKNVKLIAGSEDNGLFISTDDGETWSESVELFASYRINDIDIYNDKIYVSSNGIYTSTDDGVNWERIPGNPGYPLVAYYNMNRNGKIFAYTELGLYTSTDAGSSWSFNPMKDINKDYLSGILLNKNDKLYAWSSYSDYFLYSDDDGETWNNVPGFEGTSTYALKENSLGYLYLANGPGYSSSLYLSKDNGQSWDKILDNFGSYSLGIGENDELIYTDDITVYYSIDYGNTWVPKTCNELMGRYGRENLEMDGDFIWISHSQDGILMSSDRGNTWNEINEGLRDSTYVGEFQVNYLNKIANTLYTGLAYGLFTYDFDNRTWVLSDSGIVPSAIVRVDHLKDKHIYALTSTGVYRTVDSVVSVEENKIADFESDINAYPNPFNNFITINITGNNKTETIIISDLFGRTVQTKQTEILESDRTYDLRLSTDELPQGVYFIKVQGSQGARVILKVE